MSQVWRRCRGGGRLVEQQQVSFRERTLAKLNAAAFTS